MRAAVSLICWITEQGLATILKSNRLPRVYSRGRERDNVINEKSCEGIPAPNGAWNPFAAFGFNVRCAKGPVNSRGVAERLGCDCKIACADELTTVSQKNWSCLGVGLRDQRRVHVVVDRRRGQRRHCRHVRKCGDRLCSMRTAVGTGPQQDRQQ